MRAALVLTLLVASTLAGCAGEAAPEEDVEAFDSVETRATDTTGVIRGVVLDESFVPVADALVAMQEGTETLSTAEGAFVFEDVEPGTHFLEVRKTGFATQQVSSDVVAGVDRPPVLKVLMQRDLTGLPFSEVFHYAGFLQCGVGLGAAGVGRGVNPCAVADSVNTFDTPVQRPVDFIQGEMIWQPTSGVGDTLSLGIMNETTVLPEDHVQVDGPSPQVLRVHGSEMPPAHGDDYRDYLVRVFPGKSQPTVVFQQEFEIFLTQFYDQVPSEDWLFIEDGPWEDPGA